MKIQEIEIVGFKGITKLDLHPKQINLIVGKNNTGKTSILEAINSTLGVNAIDMKRRYDPHISSLINVNTKESKIVIKLEREAKYLLLTKPEPTDVILEFKKDLINRIKEFARSSDKDNWKVAEDILDKILTKEGLIHEIGKESIKIESSEIENKTFNLFSYTPSIIKELEPFMEYVTKEIFSRRIPPRFMESMLTRMHFLRRPSIEKSENSVVLIDELRMDEEDVFSSSKKKIDDIQTYLQDGRFIENLKRFDFDKILFEDGSEIPYSFMGDGFKCLVGLISRISPKANIVLLEEPENHMHPAYIKDLIRQIVKFSKMDNIQFFITTHNSDILDIVTTEGELEPDYENYLSQQLNVIRLECSDKDTISYELSREEAREELGELKLDLRGR